MSLENWKLENDLCRCCHSEGTHKNLSEPCLEGEEEVYSDMIHETLNINLSPVTGPLSTATFTICEACIMRLQDAWSFKQQVLQCEDRFRDLYSRNVIKLEPDSIIIDVKKETVDSDNEDFKEERLDDDVDSDFPVIYEDGHDVKSDDSDTEPVAKKAKPKPKAKTKSKAAPKKKTVQTVKTLNAAEKKGDDGQISMPYIVGERDGIRLFICSWCQKPFEKLGNFSQHYKSVHLKMRPKLRSCYMCPVKVPGYMRRKHMEEAHGVARPQCLACGKKFAFPFQVVKHQKEFHMDERPFACSMCDMRFAVASKLNRHALKHSPVRPYQCQYCEKAFRWKKNLTTHIMMHLDDRRHVCEVCSEAFVQSSSLKYHIAKKHPELI